MVECWAFVYIWWSAERSWIIHVSSCLRQVNSWLLHKYRGPIVAMMRIDWGWWLDSRHTERAREFVRYSYVGFLAHSIIPRIHHGHHWHRGLNRGLTCETWLIHMWHDSCICATRLIHMCDTSPVWNAWFLSEMSPSCVSCDQLCSYLKQLIHVCHVMCLVHIWNDSLMCVTSNSLICLVRIWNARSLLKWLIHVWHDHFICSITLIHMYDTAHSYVQRDNLHRRSQKYKQRPMQCIAIMNKSCRTRTSLVTYDKIMSHMYEASTYQHATNHSYSSVQCNASQLWMHRATYDWVLSHMSTRRVG